MKLIELPLLFLFPALGAALAPPPKVADDFHRIDFKNHSYPYQFSWGKRIRVPLENGRYEYDFRTERGWFDLSHVYVADITNDRRPEVIVMLWHVACGVSCDGGAALFYIYSFDNHRLRPLWQYETGAIGYGCGLKSFSAKRGALTVELFGRCSRRNQTASLTGKFQIKDLTRVTFKSNGSRFVVRKREFFSVPERSVLNYEPQINVAP
ncbi:MAG TPA: hypothetical protein VJT71_04505 [Pyrinomonadaceae bacterium]|nr:hypothetical protein [Pyrinomonadaceae bacterium]